METNNKTAPIQQEKDKNQVSLDLGLCKLFQTNG